MRTDHPRISVKNPRAYKQLWRDENREEIRAYDRNYARDHRRKAKLAAKRKNGGKKRGR